MQQKTDSKVLSQVRKSNYFFYKRENKVGLHNAEKS